MNAIDTSPRPPADPAATLAAPFGIEFDFSRTPGPRISAFLTALREGRLLGATTADGAVLCPPHEFDPETAEATGDLVPVADRGTVDTWTWVEGRPGDPVQGGFAWALIRLDGTRGSLFHALDVGGDPTAISAGLRVRARWRSERIGSLTDIVCFEALPEGEIESESPTAVGEVGEPVSALVAPFKMEYTYVAGRGRTVHLNGLAGGRLLARTCPVCEQVYSPTPDHCARCLADLGEPFALPGTGVVETFCIVNFPFPGQLLTPPYVVAHIRLDGAANRLMHRLQEIDPDTVELGLRVEPVWAPEDEWEPSLGSIRYFRPVDPARRAGSEAEGASHA